MYRSRGETRECTCLLVGVPSFLVFPYSLTSHINTRGHGTILGMCPI